MIHVMTEFTIVIFRPLYVHKSGLKSDSFHFFIHYKPRIAILEFQWMQMTWSGWPIQKYIFFINKRFHKNVRSKSLISRDTKGHNEAKIINIIIFILTSIYMYDKKMSTCPQTRIGEVFQILGGSGKVASVPNAPFISDSRISYFGHACPKLNLVLMSRLTGKYATQNLQNTYEIFSCLWTCWHITVISRNQNTVFRWFQPDCVASNHFLEMQCFDALWGLTGLFEK